MWRIVSRVVDGVERGAATVRRRSVLVDHVWRAQERYAEVYGGRLAAATAYYGFFAALALGVLVFALLGYALEDNPTVVGTVRDYLKHNLPKLDQETLLEHGRRLRTIAVIGLVIAGVGWVETLRSSQRAIWGLEQQPGHFVIRWLVDLAVFVILVVVLLVSVAISSGVQDVVLHLAGEAEHSPIRVALRGSSTLIAAVVDVLLAAALLTVVARLRMPLRRLVPSALLIAAGLFLIKTIGKFYVARTQLNPAYSVVAGAVGLLLFMYLLNQVVLFAAALAATDRHGTVVDLAAGRAGEPVEAAPAPPDLPGVVGPVAAAESGAPARNP